MVEQFGTQKSKRKIKDMRNNVVQEENISQPKYIEKLLQDKGIGFKLKFRKIDFCVGWAIRARQEERRFTTKARISPFFQCWSHLAWRRLRFTFDYSLRRLGFSHNWRFVGVDEKTQAILTAIKGLLALHLGFTFELRYVFW